MTKQEEFELFKKEFGRYQRLFGLEGYKINFENKSLKDRNSDICIDVQGMAANVVFDRSNKRDEKDIKKIAKHECTHLFLGRVTTYAHRRYITPDLIEEAEEEVVRKLVDLIKVK